MDRASRAGVEQRRVLLVADDTELDRLLRTAAWVDYFEIVLGAVAPLTKLIWDLAKRQQPALKNLGQKKGVPWPHASPGRAAELFDFDFGHPVNGTLYVQNPVNENHYLLPSDADERFVQEKVAAFMEIVASLGARTLTLTSATVLRREAGAEADLRHAAGQAGIGAEFEDENTVRRQAMHEFGEPTAPPHVPPGLERWLVQDPQLGAFARTRIRLRTLIKCSVSLQLRQSVELAAELVAEASKMGLKAGGHYKSVAETHWNYEVEFWPAASV